MTHHPATSRTAQEHATREAKTPAQRAAAMWAACVLMAMHQKGNLAQVFRRRAEEWNRRTEA